MKKYISLLFIILLSCSQGENFSGMNKTNDFLKINAADIKKLASYKIYFGHQSVGYNIIDALKVLAPADSGLTILETDNIKDFSKPVFAHSQNGENLKPETKIEAFVQKMNSGLGNKVNIAFFKFCYVDITAVTDVNKLFSIYKSNMNGLIKKYPKTIFLHATAPLTAENSSIKSKIKSVIKGLIGRKSGDDFDNIKRMEFNELLRKEYGSKVFDLAAVESSGRSGEEILSGSGGTKHQKLLPQYTSDGGHLNAEGGNVAALKLFDLINSQTK